MAFPSLPAVVKESPTGPFFKSSEARMVSVGIIQTYS